MPLQELFCEMIKSYNILENNIKNSAYDWIVFIVFLLEDCKTSDSLFFKWFEIRVILVAKTAYQMVNFRLIEYNSRLLYNRAYRAF